jgi:hypothetical protein
MFEGKREIFSKKKAFPVWEGPLEKSLSLVLLPFLGEPLK